MQSFHMPDSSLHSSYDPIHGFRTEIFGERKTNKLMEIDLPKCSLESLLSLFLWVGYISSSYEDWYSTNF